MEDTFDSSISQPDLEVVLSVCVERNIDPTSSAVSEAFFAEVVSIAKGNGVDLRDAVRKILDQFVSVSEPPSWIQNPDWQFANGRPIIFVGQIRVPAQTGYFHDDAFLYVFLDPDSGETKTLVQVA